ncbi:MAG: ParB N-terminal domain-containing protein [Oscillospiraceae bacterium]|nr:ParB N-terminal domain-containing protein [Oscillospiraceae bacterium]
MATKTMKKLGFDLGDVLSQVLPPVSDSDTGMEQITYLDINALDEDKANFYHIDGIADLVANIELVGLQQPLRVRPSPETPDRYVIVSGHRRRCALKQLYQENPERWARVPCIIEAIAESAAMQELRLIYANASTRKLTSYDLNQQAERVERLLYQLKEEGYDFPGRMRDHVAEACRVSKTKLATLSVIRKGLDKVWMPKYKTGKLSEDAAYTLAKLDAARQQAIFDACKSVYNPSSSLLNRRVRELDIIDKIQCPKKFGGGSCTNKPSMLETFRTLESYHASRCTGCCANCPYLMYCKQVCPKLKEIVKQKKAEAKAEKQAAQAEKAAKEQPDIDLIQLLWRRWDTARQSAGMSVEDAFAVGSKYYSKGDEERIEGIISGKKVKATDWLPYHCSMVTEIRALLESAQAFGVDVRYLLGLTDTMTPPDHAGTPQFRSGTPTEKTLAWCVFVIDGTEFKTAAVWWPHLGKWCFEHGTGIDGECVGWVPLPD